MAYMHESVHICHVDVRFFMQSPFPNSYPGNFVFVMIEYVQVYIIQLSLIAENAPEGEEKDKKILKKILKNFFMIKKFW